MREDLFMHEVLEHEASGKYVLDLGCGPGTLDYSKYRQQKFFPADFWCLLRPDIHADAKAHFVRLDSCSLPYKNDSFDICICNFVLEHVRKPIETLAEVNRVLRTGGLFYASIPNYKSPDDRLYRRLYKGSHVQRYTFKSFLDLVYESTALKMISFCNWPGGFIFLVGKYKRYQNLAYSMCRFINRMLGRNVLSESSYLFLFKKGTKPGLRVVDATCRECGSGHLYKDDKPHWTCECCGAINLRV